MTENVQRITKYGSYYFKKAADWPSSNEMSKNRWLRIFIIIATLPIPGTAHRVLLFSLFVLLILYF